MTRTPDRPDAGDEPSAGRGTVGVYDRPASADGRAWRMRAAAWGVAAAIGALTVWWWLGTPGPG